MPGCPGNPSMSSGPTLLPPGSAGLLTVGCAILVVLYLVVHCELYLATPLLLLLGI